VTNEAFILALLLPEEDSGIGALKVCVCFQLGLLYFLSFRFFTLVGCFLSVVECWCRLSGIPADGSCQLLVVGCRLSSADCFGLSVDVWCWFLVVGSRLLFVGYWLLIVCVGCRLSKKLFIGIKFFFFVVGAHLCVYTEYNLAPISHTYAEIPPPPTPKCTLHSATNYSST
jgi:hypothetical protein